MAGKITTVRIPSTPMKKGVQSTIDLADQAIETGEKILALSKKSLAASIGKGNKAAIRAASNAENLTSVADFPISPRSQRRLSPKDQEP